MHVCGSSLDALACWYRTLQVVVCGVGAAGYTCARYFITLGMKKENLLAVDVKVRRGGWTRQAAMDDKLQHD
jgi:malic enzyme